MTKKERIINELMNNPKYEIDYEMAKDTIKDYLSKISIEEKIKKKKEKIKKG